MLFLLLLAFRPVRISMSLATTCTSHIDICYTLEMVQFVIKTIALFSLHRLGPAKNLKKLASWLLLANIVLALVL